MCPFFLPCRHYVSLTDYMLNHKSPIYLIYSWWRTCLQTIKREEDTKAGNEKDGQENGQRERTNNDLQSNTQKTEDRGADMNSGAPEELAVPAPTSGTRIVSLVTNLVIWGKDWEVSTTSGNLWHGYSATIIQVIVPISTYPFGTLSSIASLLAATLCQILTGTTSSGTSDQLRDKSYRWKRASIDGMSCLQTMNQMVKNWHQWMGCPFDKWLITRFKAGTYGWDLLFTKKEYLG